MDSGNKQTRLPEPMRMRMASKRRARREGGKREMIAGGRRKGQQGEMATVFGGSAGVRLPRRPSLPGFDAYPLAAYPISRGVVGTLFCDAPDSPMSPCVFRPG